MENMKKRAYVEKIDGDMAVLKIKRECACQNAYNCNSKCFSLQEDTITVSVKNDIGAENGDFVEVQGKTASIIAYAAVVFMLPLIIGFALYYISAAFVSSAAVPYIISVTGFILSVFFLYYFLNKVVSGRNDFFISKIITPQERDI